MVELTVTEDALIDLQKQQKAIMARAKTFQPSAATREPGDTTLPADYVDALTPPVRIEISFEHPVATRKQIEVLAAAIVEAQVLTTEHKLGINNQRLRLRSVMKTAADTLVYMRGKAPSGKRRPGTR